MNTQQIAEQLAAAVMPEQPLYIICQSDNPPSRVVLSGSFGCTAPALDLALSAWLTSRNEWRGRQSAIYIDDCAIRARCSCDEAFAIAMHTLLCHEFAHAAEHQIDMREPTGDEVRAATSAIELEVAGHDLQSIIPPWEGGHDSLWIRRALHLGHRAALAGFPVAGDALYSATDYRLSPPICYARALGDEFDELIDVAIADLDDIDPPQAFASLWCADVIRWMREDDALSQDTAANLASALKIYGENEV